MNPLTDNPQSPPPAAAPTLELQVLSSPPPPKRRKTRRRGKIAHLPKLERDLVGNMLEAGARYGAIVAALDKLAFPVTARNVSNWVTGGGYEEWRQEQERAALSHQLQDTITGYLRPGRADPTELPEVGLQMAATYYSQLLLQPETQQQLLADPKQFLSVVNALCRLNREILSLQKYRDACAAPSHPGYERQKDKREYREFVKDITRNFTVATPDQYTYTPLPPEPPAVPAPAPAVPVAHIVQAVVKESADSGSPENRRTDSPCPPEQASAGPTPAMQTSRPPPSSSVPLSDTPAASNPSPARPPTAPTTSPPAQSPLAPPANCPSPADTSESQFSLNLARDLFYRPIPGRHAIGRPAQNQSPQPG